jgi:hypothetical protein
VNGCNPTSKFTTKISSGPNSSSSSSSSSSTTTTKAWRNSSSCCLLVQRNQNKSHDPAHGHPHKKKIKESEREFKHQDRIFTPQNGSFDLQETNAYHHQEEEAPEGEKEEILR